MSNEPSKLAIATGSAIAAVAVTATIAVLIPLWTMAFICNLPKAICDAEERRRRNQPY